MLKYVFNDKLGPHEPVMFCAEDQRWDDATLKQLKEEYDVVFMTSGDGVMPIMMIDKDSDYPLLVLGTEDDGTICFSRRYGQFRNRFSVYWVKSLIADLKEAERLCASRK